MQIGRGRRLRRPVNSDKETTGDMPCKHGAIYAMRAIYPRGADAICCKFCEFATRGGANGRFTNRPCGVCATSRGVWQMCKMNKTVPLATPNVDNYIKR